MLLDEALRPYSYKHCVCVEVIRPFMSLLVCFLMNRITEHTYLWTKYVYP
jgi:hypothetical protein